MWSHTESIAQHALENCPDEFGSLPGAHSVLSQNMLRCSELYSKFQPEFSIFYPIYRLSLGSGTCRKPGERHHYKHNLYLDLGRARYGDLKAMTGTRHFLVD